MNSTMSLKYQSKDVDAMRAVASAAKERNLALFENCKKDFSA